MASNHQAVPQKAVLPAEQLRAAPISSALETKFKFYHHGSAETLLLSWWWRRVKASQETDAVAISRLLYTLQSAYWQLLLLQPAALPHSQHRQKTWEIHFDVAQCHCLSTCASINVTSPRGATHKDEVRHQSVKPVLWLPPTLMGWPLLATTATSDIGQLTLIPSSIHPSTQTFTLNRGLN